MRNATLVFGVIVLSLLVPAAQSPAEEAARPEHLAFFEKKIRPVLVANCYECHSAQAAAAGKLKGGLALDTREGARRGGDSGPAVTPGNPEESLLLAAMRYDGYEMPPKGQLPAAVIADFEKWIDDGAADPRDGAAAPARAALAWDEARRFWSLEPIFRGETPGVQEESWPQGDVDRFVLSRLEAEGLSPVGDADAATLARRLYFDLTGLPPTPEQIDEFLRRAEQDRSAAVAALVDELLASPHFGERWARHWLDVVRYADSNGRDVNAVWYDARRYRDWVIDALNRDVPYDRFVLEQVAGDLLPAATAEERDRQRIATGMLAMTPQMIGEQNQELRRMDVVDDQIDVLGRTFLGLSISCARCHDHKFDPIPTADYYALAGILRSTEPHYGFARVGVKNSPHTDLIPVGPQAESLGEAGLEYRRRLVERHMEFQQARSARYGVVRRVADAKNQLAKPDADKDKLEADIARMEAEVAAWDEKIKSLEEQLQQFIDNPAPQPEWAMGVRDRDEPADCHIRIRGEIDNLGEPAPRGVLRIIPLDGLPPIPPDGSGRLHLARWLSHGDNPLTPRVAVNRIWMHLLGRGLVSTPDDFGVTGSPPSHPELVEHLAHTFVEDGWSVKRLIRRIVLSRTYQLASREAEGSGDSKSPLARSLAADPDNVLLARFRPRRLSAEVFRDAVMAVSGRLDLSPPAEPFLARWARYEHDQLKSFRPFVTPGKIEHAHRSIYLPVLRGSLPELFELFDFADPHGAVAQREESTVPAQALFVMNSPWMTERAEWTAERLLGESSLSDAERIDLLFRLALARRPTPRELNDSLGYLTPETTSVTTEAGAASPPGGLREDRWTSFCQIILGSAEFRYIQ